MWKVLRWRPGGDKNPDSGSHKLRVSVPSPDKWGDFVSKGTWNKINQTCGSILCGNQLRVAYMFWYVQYFYAWTVLEKLGRIHSSSVVIVVVHVPPSAHTPNQDVLAPLSLSQLVLIGCQSFEQQVGGASLLCEITAMQEKEKSVINWVFRAVCSSQELQYKCWDFCLMWKMFCLFPAGDSVSTVRLRRTLHLHVAHTWRTSDLPSLQLLQVLAVCRRYAGEETLRHTNESFSSLFLSVLIRDVHNRGLWFLWCVAARSPGHPGGRTRQQLRWDRCQGQTDGAAAESPTAGGTGGPDPEGAELPAGQSETPWRFFVFVRNTWRPWTWIRAARLSGSLILCTRPKKISLTEHFHHFTCCQHQFPDNMKPVLSTRLHSLNQMFYLLMFFYSCLSWSLNLLWLKAQKVTKVEKQEPIFCFCQWSLHLFNSN